MQAASLGLARLRWGGLWASVPPACLQGHCRGLGYRLPAWLPACALPLGLPACPMANCNAICLHGCRPASMHVHALHSILIVSDVLCCQPCLAPAVLQLLCAEEAMDHLRMHCLCWSLSGCCLNPACRIQLSVSVQIPVLLRGRAGAALFIGRQCPHSGISAISLACCCAA